MGFGERLRGRAVPVSLTIALVGIVAAIYGRSCSFHFVNWDDGIHVYQNRSVMAPGEVGPAERWFPRTLGYPMPLTIATYRLDRWRVGAPRDFGPQDGAAFHATNVLIGALLVLAVLSLALQVLPWKAALAGTAVFALHPVNTEMIAWISGRKDLLALALALVATTSWIRFLRTGAAWWSLGFLVLGLSALAAKPSAVFLLPLALYLLWLSREGQVESGRGRWVTILPLAVLAVAACAAVIVSYEWNRAVGGVETPATWAAVPRRALWAFGRHMSLVLSPVALRARYLADPSGLSGYDLLGGVTVVAALLGLRLAPRGINAIQLGLAVGLLGYLPMSSLIPLRRYISTIYAVPLALGMVLVAAGVVCQHLGSLRLLVRRIIAACAIALTLLLATLTWNQVGTWRDSVTLWQHQAALEPRNAMDCRMLGHAFGYEGDLEAAIKTYTACAHQFGLSAFANNLGVSHFMKGRYREAEKYFRWILQRDPDDRRARKYLGLIRER